MDPHEDAALSALIKEKAPYHTAPPGLRDRISASLDQAKPVSTPAKSRPSWGLGWGIGVGFACGAILTVMVMLFTGIPGQQDRLVAQVIDGHVRSLLLARLADVASSDQHTVKPWFSAKLDFSPPVQDLTAQGFPLLGGRLDYIDAHPVAALVYQHRLHTINVFVWPVSAKPQAMPDTASRRGINVTAWQAGGMQFWAVSDLNARDLQRFGQLLQVPPKL